MSRRPDAAALWRFPVEYRGVVLEKLRTDAWVVFWVFFFAKLSLASAPRQSGAVTLEPIKSHQAAQRTSPFFHGTFLYIETGGISVVFSKL